MTTFRQLINLAGKLVRAVPVMSFVGGLMLFVICPAEQAAAAKFKVIHAFTGGEDGKYPEAGLTVDTVTGDMYGTTFGSVGAGALGKNCGKSCGNQDKVVGNQVTADFFFKGGTDGAFPTGEVAVVDSNGSPIIYGTTEFGGGTACGGLGCGTVFLFSGSGSPTVFKFCPPISFPACKYGAFPHAGPILDSEGNAYGTTMLGGKGSGYQCDNDFGGCGTVYMLSPDLQQPTVLHSFCIKLQCQDGAIPLGGLLRDPTTGNLYGTTQFGGDFAAGTIFELQLSNGKYSYHVLYSFCQNNVTGCPDGSVPEAGLFADTAGNLYGTASAGGGGNCKGSSPGCGVVFRFAPDSRNYTVLHAFTGDTDGALPQAPVVVDPATGNLYGTTEKGGHGKHCTNPPLGCGTVFMLAPDGTETILHRFGRIDLRTDGAQPEGALLLYNGYLYGATRVEGDATCNCGTLFKINIQAQNEIGPTRRARGLPARRVIRPDHSKTNPTANQTASAR